MRYLVALSVCACGSAPPVAKPVACAPPVTVLHVDSIPAQRGERLEYDEQVTFEAAGLDGQFRSESHFATIEAVRDVSDDVIASLEVQFVEGYLRIQMGNAPPERVDVAGRVFVVGFDAGKDVFTEDGAPAPADVARALDAYARNDVGQLHWLLRILTDRTFIAGKQTYLPPESARGFGEERTGIRVTLKTVENGLARFALELESTDQFPVLLVGEVVLDVARARLASLELSGQSGAASLRIGAAMSMTIRQRFSYGPTVAPSRKPDPCAEPPVTLHLTWVPPRVGETFAHASTVKADLVVRGGGGETRVVGDSLVETENTVHAVAEGLIATLEIHVRRGEVRMPGESELVLTGDTIRVAHDSDGVSLTRNGVAVTAQDPAVSHVLRGDTMLRYWVTRLVTDRSFQRGVEMVFREEDVPLLGKEPSEVRMMFTGREGTLATFQIGIKARYKTEEGSHVQTYRGHLVFDTAASRPTRLTLRGTFEVPDGVESEGVFTIEQRFAHRSP